MTGTFAPTTQHPDRLADQVLKAGVQAARAGKRKLARQLLLKVTELDPTQEEAWLWLGGVAETSEEALIYLQTVLALNPNNQQAQKGLQWIRHQHPPDIEAQPCPHCHNVVPGGTSQCPICGFALSPEAEALSAMAEPGPEAASGLSTSGEFAPRLVLSVEQAEAIDRYLDRMASRSNARCIILADVTGQLIAERGQTRLMNTQVLTALAAGELVATQELARLVGERARFKLLLNEGENLNVYLSDVAEQLLLVIVSDNDTPIGLVRLVLKQAVEELTPILMQPTSTVTETATNEALGGDFAQLLESELDASLEL
jgi:predicted regulator of Ras-like GTPase activity (Roadblock/LC7/MglB family)